MKSPHKILRDVKNEDGERDRGGMVDINNNFQMDRRHKVSNALPGMIKRHSGAGFDALARESVEFGQQDGQLSQFNISSLWIE